MALNADLLPGLGTLGGPTGLTGGGLDWLAVIMGYQSAAAADRALEPVLDAADPGDLMIRTTLTGRRLPGWDAGGAGVWRVFRPSTGRCTCCGRRKKEAFSKYAWESMRSAPVGRRSAR